jgi:uncharacterized protein YdaU (DUF1376 family)
MEWLRDRGWVDSEREERWGDIKDSLQAFYDREGHMRVPCDHTENGVAIGHVIARIRRIGTSAERMEWLRDRGYVDSELVARWDDLQVLLQSFYDREGHLRVPRKHVENGVEIGTKVHHIRNNGTFVDGHPQRMDWLRRHGWVDGERDAQWDDLKDALQSFYDREGHLRVPHDHIENDVSIGSSVAHIRNRGTSANRMEWLRERGWVESECDARWEDLKIALQSFYDRNGHLRVSSRCMENGVAIGPKVRDMRSNGTFITNHPGRMQWLRERGWVDSEHTARWLDLKAAFQSFYERHQHLKVPPNWVEAGVSFASTAKKIRARGDFVNGHPDRIIWLYDHGFQLNALNPAENALRWKALFERHGMTPR